ncbi:MAG: ankyrin repeat domain-containing protein [Pseudomonadota bacterium]
MRQYFFGMVFLLASVLGGAQAGAETLDERLIEAVQWGDVPTVQQLLTDGADPNSTLRQRTALSWAVQGDSAELVQQLLKAGANPNLTDLQGNNALSWAAQLGKVALIAPLVAAGASVNEQNSAGNTPVLIAVSDDNLELLSALVEAGADMNAANIDGATPALMAVQGYASDAAATLTLLAKGGADLDLGNRFYTPLTFAAEQDNEPAVAALLDAGADPNAGVDGSYPLIKGASSAAIVGRLLLAGANPNVKNDWGEPALFAVIDYGTPKLVQAMIDAGADFTTPSEQGQTPLDRARVQGMEDIEAVLLAAGAGGESDDASEQTSAADPGLLANIPTGELAEMPKLGMVTVMGGAGGGITYFSSSTLAELTAFYQDLLAERGWKAAGNLTTDDATYFSGSYTRSGESLSLYLSQNDSNEDRRARVSLTPHGSAKPADLPRVAGTSILYEGPATAIYVSELSVVAVSQETLSLLTQAGWNGAATVDTETMQVLTLDRGGVRLTAQVSQAPAQGNKTTIQYSVVKQ